MRASSILLCCSLACLTGACADVAPRNDYYPALQRDLDHFKIVQREFNAAPQKAQWSFPGIGDVIVRELALEGYPGNTYVRSKFHFKNASHRNIRCCWVSLDVLDAKGTMVSSQVSVLITPVATAIPSGGTYFADELRTQTRDAHLQPGWSWRITCKAEFEDEEPMLRR